MAEDSVEEEDAGIEYDDDIVQDDQDEEGQNEEMDLEEDEGDDASIADEEADYSYVMDEVLEEDSDLEFDGDEFDWFAD